MCIDIDECAEITGLCSQRCINYWGSYRCACESGYRLNTNNRTCEDIDECEVHKSYNLCTGVCENTPGSYQCTCPPGYKLATDGRTCQGMISLFPFRPNPICIINDKILMETNTINLFPLRYRRMLHGQCMQWPQCDLHKCQRWLSLFTNNLPSWIHERPGSYKVSNFIQSETFSIVHSSWSRLSNVRGEEQGGDIKYFSIQLNRETLPAKCESLSHILLLWGKSSELLFYALSQGTNGE